MVRVHEGRIRMPTCSQGEAQHLDIGEYIMMASGIVMIVMMTSWHGHTLGIYLLSIQGCRLPHNTVNDAQATSATPARPRSKSHSTLAGTGLADGDTVPL